MAIRDFLKSALNRLLPRDTISQAINVQVAISGKMDSAISLWHDMYENEPPWKGGKENTVCMNLPAAISEELARLVLTEFSIEYGGSTRADFINTHLQRNITNLNEYMELYCANGGIVIKPYVNGGILDFDFTQANKFYPTAYNSNKEITGAVFVGSKRQGDYLYTRLEAHSLVGTDYVITNRAFRSERLSTDISDDDMISVEHPFLNECPLADVDEWAGLSPEPVTLRNIERPLFVYIKVPRANNIDSSSPLGCSVFSRATDVIRETDKQFSKILWEYEATEAAVHAADDLFDVGSDGKPVLPEGRERLYRAFDFSDKDSFLDVYSPQIRDASLFNGLNKFFQRIEFLCGLSYGTLSDPQLVEKTAEEIKTSKQRSFTFVSNMQSAWDKGFDHLAYIMDTYCTLYNLVAPGKVEKTCTWGDGILEDTEKEYQRRWSMVLAGKMRTEVFFAWYFGCTEEEAVQKYMQKEMKPEELEE